MVLSCYFVVEPSLLLTGAVLSFFRDITCFVNVSVITFTAACTAVIIRERIISLMAFTSFQMKL